MIKNVCLLFLTLSFYITICKEISVTVIYNDENDVIIYKDKVYVQQAMNKIKADENPQQSEEDLSESKFWSYVLMCICKFYL